MSYEGYNTSDLNVNTIIKRFIKEINPRKINDIQFEELVTAAKNNLFVMSIIDKCINTDISLNKYQASKKKFTISSLLHNQKLNN